MKDEEKRTNEFQCKTYVAAGAINIENIEHVENLFPGNKDIVETVLKYQKQPEICTIDLRPYIDKLLPYIKNGLCWFGVAKALMEKGYLGMNDFEGAEVFIKQIYPEGEIKIKARELSRLCTGSMAKTIDEWDENKQYAGKTFASHKTIALQALQIIPEAKK